MDHCKLPEEIQGNWIWQKSLINSPNSTLLVRKEFMLGYSHSVADFWISANCSYQLFINERVVGFGPRANHSARSTYVDEYDLSYYLQQGLNVIAIVVSNTLSKKIRRPAKNPGVWCQLNLDRKPFLWTDKHWDILEDKFYAQPRPLISDRRGMTESIDFRNYPNNWLKAPATLQEQWHKPNYEIPVKDLADNLQICPLTPNTVDEIYFFENRSKGSFKPACAMTHFCFNDIFIAPGVYAAVAFLFMEAEKEVEVEIIAGEIYKFFCNKTLVKSKNPHEDELFDLSDNKVKLKLKNGWNRLLILQEVDEFSAGMTLVFPDLKEGKLKIFRDTLEDAESCWNIAGPLRMPLSEATPSISFERLHSEAFLPSTENITDTSTYLKNSNFEITEATPAVSASTGEYLLFKLEELKYGFLSVDIKAAEGDIVDITLGQYIYGNDFPQNTDGLKNSHTMICRKGSNKFLKFKPEEVCYVMVSVRKAAEGIEVQELMLSEFSRNQRNLTSFQCSDEQINKIWETGCNAISRAASFICQNEPNIINTCCLGDFYFQSCNLIAIFGDYHLAEVWLRNFAEAQFENGNIPAISFGENIYSQISHLFLFPTWLLFHYRTSANDVFLKKMSKHLDLIFELFDSLIDEKSGLFKDVGKRFKSACRINSYSEQENGISTTINALYCRSLLSAGEIYRALDRPNDLFKCFKRAAAITKRINNHNWNEEQHLFATTDLDPDGCSDLFTNVIALYSGIAASSDFENIFKHFFNVDMPFSKNPEQSDLPYFNFLFTETMFALGQTQWTLEYLIDYWTRRIDDETGAWRILPDSKQIATTDFYRGNTVCPNVFLIREVAGIRVAEPGFTTIYFNPAINFVEWAKLIFPTAYGSLKVEWETLEDGSLNVTIDAKFPIKVLPELSSEVLENTTFVLGENVTLLDAGSMPDQE